MPPPFGVIAGKWRRSKVAISRTPRRSATATTDASVPPSGNDENWRTSSAMRSTSSVGQVGQLERAVGDGIEKGSLDLGATMLVEPIAGLGEDRRGQHEGLARHVQVTKEVVGREVVLVPLVRQGDKRTGVTDDQRSLPKPRDRVASM